MRTESSHVSKMFLVLFAAGMAVTAPVRAAQEAISARVTAVNEEKRSLTVSLLGKQEGLPQEVILTMVPQTQMKGIRSLEELESGDEIVFEGTEKNENEWTVLRLESSPQKTGAALSEPKAAAVTDEPRPASGFFENAKQQIRGAWYSLRYNIPVNRAVYEDYAGARLRRYEDRLTELKGKMGRKEESVESKYNEVKERFDFMKKSQSKEVWKDAKTDFEAAITQAQSWLKDASSPVLPGNAFYEWEMEERIGRLRYDLNSLHAAFQLMPTAQKNRPAGESTDYGREIQDLQKQLGDAENQLREVEKADAVKQESLKENLEGHLFSIQEAYYNLLAKIGPHKAA